MTDKKNWPNWTPEKSNVLPLDAPEQAQRVTQGRAALTGAAKPRRLPHQSCKTPPEGAKPAESCFPLGFGRSVLPVSAVARDWGISARRVRVMLAEGRLDGRLLENGYWEVFYPYKYIFGTRGPAIKRQRKPKVLDTPEFMKDHGNGASTRSG